MKVKYKSMLTMNQLAVIIDTVQLVVIFGFVFFMANTIASHNQRLKCLTEGETTKKNCLNQLRTQFLTKLGILLFCLLGAITLIGYFQALTSGDAGVSFMSNPNWRNTVFSLVINVVRISVVFCFLGAGTKLFLGYREKVAKLKHDEKEYACQSSNTTFNHETMQHSPSLPE